MLLNTKKTSAGRCFSEPEGFILKLAGQIPDTSQSFNSLRAHINEVGRDI